MLKKINEQVKKFELFLVGRNNITFIIFSFLILLAIITPIGMVKYIFDITATNSVMKDKNIFESFIIGVILGPLLETLIFQIGVIKISLYFNKDKTLAILISALAFGLTHIFNAYYFVYAFGIGLYFAYLYFLSLKKGIKPFWSLSVVHALFNLTVFCFKFVF